MIFIGYDIENLSIKFVRWNQQWYMYHVHHAWHICTGESCSKHGNLGQLYSIFQEFKT